MQNKIFIGAIVVFIITISAVLYFSPKGFSQNVPSDTGTSTEDISTDLSISSITITKKGGKSDLTIGLSNVAPPADLFVPIKVIFNAKAAEALTLQPISETGVSVKATTATNTFKVNNSAFCPTNNGTSTITVALDLNGEVQESNENNNIKSLILPCSYTTTTGGIDGYPPLWVYGKGVIDLAVTSVTVKKKNATSYTWTANFKNTAQKNSKMDMNVLFNMNAQTGTSSKQSIISTAAKTVAQSVLIKTICPDLTGTSTVTIALDPSDKIKEINETNNISGYAFNCTTFQGYYISGYPKPIDYGIIQP